MNHDNPPFTPGRFDYLLISEPERCHADALAEDVLRAEASQDQRPGLIPVIHDAEGEEPTYEYLPSLQEVMIRSMAASFAPDATPDQRREIEAVIRSVPF